MQNPFEWLGRLVGNDVFISYRRADGLGYAQALANALMSSPQEKLSVYLDLMGTPPGKKMPARLLRRLRWSSLLVVVGTKGAIDSPNILGEIDEFPRKEHIIPIDVGGVLKDATWFSTIDGLPIQPELVDALGPPAVPSPAVIQRIFGVKTYTRLRNRVRRTVGMALTMAVLLVGGAAWYSTRQVKQEEIAAAAAERRQGEAEQQQRKATTVAELERGKAADAKAAAEQETRNAAEQRRLAEELGHSADALKMSSEALLRLPDDPNESLRLAIAAANRSTNPPPQVTYAIRRSLAEACRKEHLGRHGSSVNSVAFSADGQRLVSAGHDDIAKIWSLRGGKPIVLPHPGEVMGASFGPDSDRVLTFGLGPFPHYGRASLWNTDGKRLAELSQEEEIDQAFFGPRPGTLMTVSSRGRGVRIWAADAAGSPPRPLESMPLTASPSPGPASDTTQQPLVASSGDGGTVVYVAADRRPTIIVRGQRTHLPTWPGDVGDNLRDLLVSPRGGWLAASTFSGRFRLWDLRRATQIPIPVEEPHQGQGVDMEQPRPHVTTLAFSDDEGFLFVGRADGSGEVWETFIARQVSGFRATSRFVQGATFSPKGGELVAYFGGDRTVRVRRTSSGDLVAELRGYGFYPQAVAFSPDSRLLATGSQNGSVDVFTLPAAQPFSVKVPASTDQGDTTFSVDGKRLGGFLRDRSGVSGVWDTRRGQPVPVPWAGPITDIRFAPGGPLVAATGSDGTVRVWNALTGTGLQETVVAKNFAHTASIRADGKVIASIRKDELVQVLSAVGGKVLAALPALGAMTVGFSSRGNLLIVATKDAPYLLLWSYRTNRKTPLPDLTDHVAKAAFDREGAHLAAAQVDGSLYLWNVEDVLSRTRGARPLLNERTDFAFDLAFSPSGRFLAAGTNRGIYLWDVRERTRLMIVTHGNETVRAIAFRGQRELVSFWSDGTLQTDLCTLCAPLAKLLARAASVVGTGPAGAQ